MFEYFTDSLIERRMTELSIFLKSILVCTLLALNTEAKSSAILFDTCTINYDCNNAIIFQNVESDGPSICINGCNELASPESMETNCGLQDFPTVWYEINVDDDATILNIEVSSLAFDAPTITLYESISGCDEIETVGLTNSNLLCIVGSGGVAKAIGTQVTNSTKYFIAISSLNS